MRTSTTSSSPSRRHPQAAPGIPSDKLALYDRLVASNPNVERKGFAMPYTALNGHMFSFLTKTGTMGLRLPAGERDSFLKTFHTKICEQYGVVMKEYVEVPEALLKRTRELKKFFERSYTYVASLKAKPTTRKKKVEPDQGSDDDPGSNA